LAAYATLPSGAKRWTVSLRDSPVALETSYEFPAPGFMSDLLSAYAYRAYTAADGPAQLEGYLARRLPDGDALRRTGPPSGLYDQSGFELSAAGPRASGYSEVEPGKRAELISPDYKPDRA
jgi:hypothetical protein